MKWYTGPVYSKINEMNCIVVHSTLPCLRYYALLAIKRDTLCELGWLNNISSMKPSVCYGIEATLLILLNITINEKNLHAVMNYLTIQ